MKLIRKMLSFFYKTLNTQFFSVTNKIALSSCTAHAEPVNLPFSGAILVWSREFAMRIYFGSEF